MLAVDDDERRLRNERFDGDDVGVARSEDR